jgi:hypothetical protein
MRKWTGRITTIALIGMAFLLISFKVHSDVVSGTAVMTSNEWDFSEAASVR